MQDLGKSRIPATQSADESPNHFRNTEPPTAQQAIEIPSADVQQKNKNHPRNELDKTTEAAAKPKENSAKTNENLVIVNTENTENINFSFWLGMGENYQYQQQSVPSVSGQSKFQNIQGPSLSVAARLLGKKLGAEVAYKEIPGRMESSSSVTVVDGNFNWKILSIDSLYKFENSNTFLKSGLQFDSVPYMDLNAVNATLTVRSNTITTFKVGFEKNYLFSEKVRGEWIMQYQHPILTGTSNGNNFTIKPEFAFNGSIGSIYKFNETMHFGIFWYGQWYQYNFEYGTNSSVYSGKQILFYSNLDLRIGWNF